MNKEELLKKAYEDGLIDVIKEWLKEEKYVSISSLQRSFSIGYGMSSVIFEELINLKLVDDKPFYDKGHIVNIYNKFSNMKIYLLDINPEITRALKKEFAPFNEVEVVLDDFAHFMDTHEDIECIVSPANSFGMMNGGYDKAITDYFSRTVERRVQAFIKRNYFGEQPLGTSIMVDIPGSTIKLIHTPTMRLPSPIKDPLIIYQCMRVTMIMAIKNNIHSIVIPAFGGATGKVPPSVVAKYMKEGYKQIRKYRG